MLAIKLIAEGLGLGFLLYLICAIGIRNGVVGMVHLYDKKVQERVVELGLTTAQQIRKWSGRQRTSTPGRDCFGFSQRISKKKPGCISRRSRPHR